MPLRHVALFALALLLALPPGLASTSTFDECAKAGTTGCTQIDRPASQAGPAKTYYLWTASSQCAPNFSDPCMGRPLNPNSTAPLGLAGVLYEESNGYPGLQRSPIVVNNHRYQADVADLI